MASHLVIMMGSMQRVKKPVAFRFLRTEVELASVFADIAAQAEDGEKKLRNAQKARRAYETLVHFTGHLRLTGDERREMQEKISKLRRQLISLGEEL
jgi:hypothetical protein